jgi:hypothetical protein
MKTSYLTIMIILLLLGIPVAHAQNTNTNINQVELMKQFFGTWMYEVSKDTTAYWNAISYGTGFECYDKFVTQGEIVMEGKQLWGYDKRVDKYIGTQMIKGEDIGIYASWFITKNKYEFVPYNNISDPEKASFKIEGEIKSPDMFVETTIINNKSVKVYTYTRVKN